MVRVRLSISTPPFRIGLGLGTGMRRHFLSALGKGLRGSTRPAHASILKRVSAARLPRVRVRVRVRVSRTWNGFWVSGQG